MIKVYNQSRPCSFCLVHIYSTGSIHFGISFLGAQFGAFHVGTHDDLVTALGLACLCERAVTIPEVVSRHRREASDLFKGYWD